MIRSAHQPAYLPWPGYFDKINKADTFVILDDVQFERNSYINRNKIAVIEQPHWLTVPVHITGHITSTIRQTQIDNTRNWRHKHWETIRHNYCKAKYWDDIKWLVHDCVFRPQSTLDSVSCNLSLLPLLTTVYRQSKLGVTGEKQDLIINLCKYFKADAFLFGRNGREYVDEAYFRAQGIKPLFQEFTYPIYRQFGEDFIPGLSIVDMLFHCGEAKTREMVCGR